MTVKAGTTFEINGCKYEVVKKCVGPNAGYVFVNPEIGESAPRTLMVPEAFVEAIMGKCSPAIDALAKRNTELQHQLEQMTLRRAEAIRIIEEKREEIRVLKGDTSKLSVDLATELKDATGVSEWEIVDGVKTLKAHSVFLNEEHQKRLLAALKDPPQTLESADRIIDDIRILVDEHLERMYQLGYFKERIPPAPDGDCLDHEACTDDGGCDGSDE